MPDVAIVSDELMKDLIFQIQEIKGRIDQMNIELKEAKKPYLTAQDLMELTGFSKTWFNSNKQDVGYSMVGGCLRFKRSDVMEYMDKNYFKSKKR